MTVCQEFFLTPQGPLNDSVISNFLRGVCMGQLRIPINALILWFESGAQITNKTSRKSFILPLHLQAIISTEEQRAGLRSCMDKLSISAGDYTSHAFGLKD